MKKLVILSFTVLFFLTINSFAAKYRVNNNSGTDPDFTSIGSAISGASTGDTIYVEGSSVNYGTASLNKKLYIFGPGYFLTQNPETQANPASASFSTINLHPGSAGSFITGLVITDYLYINDNNITIKRNYVYDKGISINDGNSNIMIIQNYLTASYYYYPAINIETNCSNIIIQNNYISRTTEYTINILGTTTAIISQNVINGKMYVRNSNITNCIMYNGALTHSYCSFQKNIGDATQFPIDAANSIYNLQNVNMLTVFDSIPISPDGKKQLIAGSPAIGYGVGGYDCGMFGGVDPYILSGIPAIPAIYFFNSPSSGSSSTGLPVNVKIKSRK